MSEATVKKDIRMLTKEALGEWFAKAGEKSYRAVQVYEWLWKKSARSFDEMTNLSKSLRQLLEAQFVILPVTISETQCSDDGTAKYAFSLHDGHIVEGVLIPASKRMTACISSQAGCGLTCGFCATGKMEMERNLSAGEIYDQVVLIRQQAEEQHNTPLTNIVYMGMGEPLLNYKNVLSSIEKLTSPNGLGMSSSRITLSTAGIAKMIIRLGDDGVKFNLALSLHAANDEKRNRIMPVNRQNSLESLKDALLYFYKKTGNKVTYEYIIFKDLNDDISDAKELLGFCGHIPCKVNIIEYNPVKEAPFQQADAEKTEAFISYLKNKNLIVNYRQSRGRDIQAACGQLASRNKQIPV